MTDDEIIDWILDVLEAGEPAYGVTAAMYAAHYHVAPATVTGAELAALVRDEAAAIWLTVCLLAPGFFRVVDWQLRLALVQFAGAVGRAHVVAIVQGMLRLEPTGVADSDTIRALNGHPGPERQRGRVLALQLEHGAGAGASARTMRRVARVLTVC